MKALHLPAQFLPALMILLLCSCVTQAAPPEGKGKSDKSGFDVDTSISGVISAGITIGDARNLAVKHNLAGAKPLPPGIRKNLARGKPMPPGIAKTRLPDGFIDALPSHPGYHWEQAGTDLVLIASGSLIISDILEGVFD